MRAIVEARDPGVNFSAALDARGVHFDKAVDKARRDPQREAVAVASPRATAMDDDAARKIHR
jgi:hypothetical protein